jgi:PAS domain S-box-containing protein
MRSLAPDADRLRTPLRALFYEDCEEDIELCLRTLRAASFDVAFDVAVTPDGMLERLRAADYDVILSDYRMPSATGMDVYEALRSEGVRTPFILVTGSLGDETAVECLKKGVADYVLKDRLARLPVAVSRAQEESRLRSEQARKVAELRSSEASYRSLTQSAPCGILRLSAIDGCLLDANRALAEMLGYSSVADLMESGDDDPIRIDPETLMRLTERAGRATDVVDCYLRWKRKGAESCLIRLAGRLLRDEENTPTCLEMIAENVTERNLAQQRIEQLNRLYSVLIHANQTIVRTRESGALFQEICRIIVEEGNFEMAWIGLVEPDTGAVIPHSSCPSRDEYLAGIRVTALDEPEGQGPVGRAIRQNRHVICNDIAKDPSMRLWWERALERTFRSLAAFPIVRRGRAIGTLTIYAACPDFFDIENVALLSELAADVSFALESIELEQMHHRVADELDQFFALSLEMLCIFDLNGRFQRVNPAWERRLGYSPAEMCARPWIEFVHPDDRHLVVVAHERLRTGADVRDLELRFLSKDGTCKWLVCNAAPAQGEGSVFAAVSDITRRKQLEEQLRAQNLKLEERNHRIETASRTKSEFLANMSHELRSPLNGIIGFSELLYDGKLGELPTRPREYVGRIHSSSSHLLQLINGVLDLSKIEAGHLEFRPERILVSALIQEVTGILSTLAHEKQIRIEHEIDAGVDEAMIDASRLRQVLYNYLSNALKFTEAGGRVIVRLKREGAMEFRLEVSDTGIGVAEEDMRRLFVEFQQLDGTTAKRYQGTGLGLALTKRIVEGQGGRVGAESVLEKGSTFFAVLPRAPRATTDLPANNLVIDDQELDRTLLTQLLEAHGHRVESAATCSDAYAKCSHGRYDLITLDLVLPDAPGWELLALIRSIENQRHTPVIVISACERDDVDVAVDVQGFLTKPVDADSLVELLKRIGLRSRAREVANA